MNTSTKIRDFLMWPVASRIFKMNFDDVVRLKNGLLMKTSLDDILGRFVIFYGPRLDYFWEPKTIQLMKILIKDAEQSVIAGSHIGYTVLMARKFMTKPNSIVHTFEPVRYLYDISKKNFKMNKNLGKIIATNTVIGDRDGDIKIDINNIKSKVSEAGSQNNLQTEKVRSVTLDTYFKKQNIHEIDFMLLDVEGYELNVFQGMSKLFTKNNPKNIIFEFSSAVKRGIDDVDKISDLLIGYGYNLFIIDDNYKLEKITKNDGVVKLYNLKNVDYLTDNKYVNILATKYTKDNLINIGITIE